MRTSARRLGGFIVCLALPPKMKPAALNLLGHSISRSARIGFSLVLVERLCMAEGARIGHLNWLHLRRAVLRPGASILSMNTIKRGLSLWLGESASIGNRNKILRGWSPSPIEPALLRLGKLSKITSEHYVEMSRSVAIGDYSIVAGVRSQFWTHGFVHAEKGPERWLVVGKINVGSNVYIGSGCIVTCGVVIADAVTLGVASSVVKSLREPGVYASQPLRFIAKMPLERLSGLERVAGATEADTHYRRSV